MSNVTIGFLIAWIALAVLIVVVVGHIWRTAIRIIMVFAVVKFFQAPGTNGSITDVSRVLDRFVRGVSEKR